MGTALAIGGAILSVYMLADSEIQKAEQKRQTQINQSLGHQAGKAESKARHLTSGDAGTAANNLNSAAANAQLTRADKLRNQMK